MAETTTPVISNAPDSAFLHEMLNSIEECKEIEVRFQMIIECFTYLTQFSEFFQTNTETAYNLRNRVKMMEVSANEFVASGQITFEKAAVLVQVINQLLDITSYLADFDCEEEIIPVPYNPHDFDADECKYEDLEEDEETLEEF